MKESHPIEVSEFAKSIGISDEPAFEWWVPYTPQKKYVILAEVKTMHKYGIELPKSQAHAYAIYTTNNNTFWRDSIKK